MDKKGAQKKEEDHLGGTALVQARRDHRLVQGGGGGEYEERKASRVIQQIKLKEIDDDQGKRSEEEGHVRS